MFEGLKEKLIMNDPKVEHLRLASETDREELLSLKHKYNNLVDQCNRWSNIAHGQGSVINVRYVKTRGVKLK